jgi:hypothetical protein
LIQEEKNTQWKLIYNSEASSMKTPPRPPRAMEGAPFREEAALEWVEVPEEDEEEEVPEPDEEELEGVLDSSLAKTLNLISVISLPV